MVVGRCSSCIDDCQQVGRPLPEAISWVYSPDVYSPGQSAATIVILVSRLSTSLQHERSQTVVGLCHQHARWSKHQASWTKQQRPCTRRVNRNTRAKHPTGRLCKRSERPSSNVISLRWNIWLPKLTNASKMQRKY